MTYNAISVTELNKYIKDKFEEDEMLNNILVKGEISNFKHHYTGHMYFTLKDENSLIKCVMFKTYTPNLNFIPKDGMQVKVLGTVSVFERDGVYQIYCKAMQQDGLGDLYKIYTELKEKLSKEGLFDDKYKKPIPYMPKCIGVLTSNTGSVIRDIINVSARRNPNVYIKLFLSLYLNFGFISTIFSNTQSTHIPKSTMLESVSTVTMLFLKSYLNRPILLKVK